jgi:hypothetical protein
MGLNPGPHIYQARAVLLSYDPSPKAGILLVLLTMDTWQALNT